MTTAQDLTIVSLEAPTEYPVERGDLSLALAGAELIDLLEGGAVALDGLVPRPVAPPETGDARLEAAAAEVGRAPDESVEEWLWRRGRGLAAEYLAAEGADDGGRKRPRWLGRRDTERPAPSDPQTRRRATERWESGDPVLAGLAAAVGIHHESADRIEDPADDRIAAVLAAVNDAVVELAAIRQRRDIEDAAFDNIWRGL
ncbi:GPP34 family phosphoprotein [Streptomyces sp. BPPL-273]|uniref:GOLPH3/VPS74 family protein n=1 Tax=Streptomyces TaxID=1883 RepID=UPI0024AF27E1|nr:GPP34 family phosphoprotein [Streptomyces sp. BPPL-273]WHM34965.1 GPP34 family phosphoprotein [Streptomyces sp. BPPL-273]